MLELVIILLHTSKTMRPPASDNAVLVAPKLLPKAKALANYLKTLSPTEIAKTMKISDKLATTTCQLISGWTDAPKQQRAAIDSFLGDIYSGLQVADWTAQDREYANQNMKILSGLYGILRPLDGIYPYRLEMGYKLPEQKYSNLYNYWGTELSQLLPPGSPIINLSAVEYSKTVTKFLDKDLLITPKFLTVSSKNNIPTFVVVHAKIARGAFANWLIKNRIEGAENLKNFTDLGYKYNKNLSTKNEPTFVCQEFGGLGLSVRLK